MITYTFTNSAYEFSFSGHTWLYQTCKDYVNQIDIRYYLFFKFHLFPWMLAKITTVSFVYYQYRFLFCEVPHHFIYPFWVILFMLIDITFICSTLSEYCTKSLTVMCVITFCLTLTHVFLLMVSVLVIYYCKTNDHKLRLKLLMCFILQFSWVSNLNVP